MIRASALYSQPEPGHPGLGSPRILAAACVAFFALLNAGLASEAPQPPPGKTHTYYIAADEVLWDYMPVGRNVTGLPIPEEELEGRSAAGKKYLKAIYREYTDATFKTLKPRPPEWEHLGILGPLIRAEVGDTVTVVFKNNTQMIPYCGMHPHGFAYAKTSEGAMYNDSSGVDKGGYVQPGKTYTYTWLVPERAGPGPEDPSSIVWMYHSHFAEEKEINAGLLGPIIVSRRGSTKPDGTPKDVDREFIAAFAIFDETASPYFDKRRYPLNFNFADPVFRKLNLLYSINGLVEGNLPVMTMKKGERVRWYLLASSNEDDVHGVHWHGQTVISNHMRTDVVSLGPMQMAVADMVPDNPGTWLLHCHVNEHLRGGMTALFKVVP
jgi:FtsP/CotA-like multicopper oxidase with cupredoxin domain